MGTPTLSSFGKIAQMVELLVEAQGADGSIPSLTTESRNNGKPPLPIWQPVQSTGEGGKIVKWA